MNPLHFIMFFMSGPGGVTPDPPVGDFSPSLDFSDARNSQHYIMGWWI